MRSTILLFVGVLAACGGDGPSGAPLPEDARAALCGDYCEHEAECSRGDAGCQAECVEGTASFRGDFVESVLTCMTDLACDADEDVCWDQGIAELTPTAAFHNWVAACEAFEDRCGASGDCDDGSMAALTDDALAAVTACYDRPCDEVSACVEDAL